MALEQLTLNHIKQFEGLLASIEETQLIVWNADDQIFEPFDLPTYGDVNGPAGATVGNIPSFNNADGKHIGDSGIPVGHIYLPFGVYTTLSPVTASADYPYSATVERTYTFVKWAQGIYVGGTNDASNFWKIMLLRWTDSAIMASIWTDASAPSTNLVLTTTTFAIGSIATSGVGIIVKVQKQGSPGSLYIIGPTLEVTI